MTRPPRFALGWITPSFARCPLPTPSGRPAPLYRAGMDAKSLSIEQRGAIRRQVLRHRTCLGKLVAPKDWGGRPTIGAWPRSSHATQGSDGEAVDLPVRLSSSGAPWGAKRWFFWCPLAPCGQRVGRLYLP